VTGGGNVGEGRGIVGREGKGRRGEGRGRKGRGRGVGCWARRPAGARGPALAKTGLYCVHNTHALLNIVISNDLE